jgi:hypothetical protein
VADHVGVGEVGDDQVEGGVVDGFDDGVADAFGGHFRGQIVGRDFLRLDEGSIFAGEGSFDAAVEEVSDVRVLFRLGYAQVAQLRVAENVGQDVIHGLGQDDQRQGCKFLSYWVMQR